MEGENFIEGTELENQPKSITIEDMTKLGELTRTHICKINSNGKKGTGFFSKIPFGYCNTLNVLITSNQVLNKNDIQYGQTINFTLDNDSKEYNILIDNKRKVYTNESYDVTVIEIKKDDNIDEKSFFEIEKKIFQENANEIFAKSQIFLLHYPKAMQAGISTGMIGLIKEDNIRIHHNCDTTNGSSGGPIINRNFEVIGIHVGAAEGEKNYNIVILLKEPIEKFYEEIKKNKKLILKNSNYIKEILIKENNNEEVENKNLENSKNKENKNENKEELMLINDKGNIDEITIGYKIDNIEHSKNIRIFGDNFVKNNKNICKIIINENEFELIENVNIDINQLKNNIFEIKLKGLKSVTNLSYLFCSCELLSYLPDISKLNTQNVTEMNYLFCGCLSLSSLPDISKWNTQNVTNMSYIFFDCELLSSLPDISKWNTQNVTNMSYMFYDCRSLSSLPDISKWNTQNVTNMKSIFSNCKSLSSLPDISKWNTQNVTNMSSMFDNCKLLSTLPDISKWNTQNVTDMRCMFYNCYSLSYLPDISKWNTQNLKEISDMFSGCNKKLKIPKNFKAGCFIF